MEKENSTSARSLKHHHSIFVCQYHNSRSKAMGHESVRVLWRRGVMLQLKTAGSLRRGDSIAPTPRKLATWIFGSVPIARPALSKPLKKKGD
jgi:hypothetical protein